MTPDDKKRNVKIEVPNVDVCLLREQRDRLLSILEESSMSQANIDALNGVISLLDTMLDVAEGFDMPKVDGSCEMSM